MKQISLLLCFFLSILIEAQTVAWSSDSEDLTGWSSNDLDGDTFIWGAYSKGFEEIGFKPGAVLYSQSWDFDPEPNGTPLTPDNFLFTPTFAIPANATSISFKMKVASIDLNFFEEKFAVFVYDDADFENTFSKIHEETLSDGGADSAKDITISIPALFAGKTLGIVIRHFDCTNQNQLLVDDFEASYSTTLSVEENELSALEIYPNPLKDVIKIDSKAIIDKIVIVNQMGQSVLEIKKERILNNRVDLGSLSSGLYQMTVTSENNSKTIKIIKK